MTKKLFFSLLLAMTVVIPLAIGTSDAFPDKSVCKGCHGVDPAVSVTASFQGCSGSDATYNVTVSNTYDAGEGWAVFDGGSNLRHSLGTSGTFTVPAGITYAVWGVSDSDQGIGGGKGGSNTVTISPDCGPTCTDGDGDTYYAEGGICGPADCDDTDPDVNPGAEEDCTNGIDDDCDGLTDAADPDAVACSPACTDEDSDLYYFEGSICGSQADCDDTNPAINPGAVEDCTDLIDNDCDDKLDCDDSDCVGVPACPTCDIEICDDGIDNDCDNKTDCSDKADCRTDAACNGSPEICDDGIDNDGDGKADCSDRKDCRTDPACSGSPEICDDGIDNDYDGKVDCTDKKDCGKDPAC